MNGNESLGWLKVAPIGIAKGLAQATGYSDHVAVRIIGFAVSSRKLVAKITRLAANGFPIVHGTQTGIIGIGIVLRFFVVIIGTEILVDLVAVIDVIVNSRFAIRKIVVVQFANAPIPRGGVSHSGVVIVFVFQLVGAFVVKLTRRRKVFDEYSAECILGVKSIV